MLLTVPVCLQEGSLQQLLLEVCVAHMLEGLVLQQSCTYAPAAGRDAAAAAAAEADDDVNDDDDERTQFTRLLLHRALELQLPDTVQMYCTSRQRWQQLLLLQGSKEGCAEQLEQAHLWSVADQVNNAEASRSSH